jgi:chromosome partition protein MukE
MIFEDKRFAEVDVILRRGGHVNRSDFIAYQFLCEHFEELRRFYEPYGCRLVQHPDGFFFLIAQGGLIRSRLLPVSCVHLGMFIALKTRDPEITRSSGRIGVQQLLQAIETSVPRDTLQRVYAPKQREASADARITEEIHRVLRLLQGLRFIEVVEDTIRPTEAIHRFAELARHENNPDQDARALLDVQRAVVFRDLGTETALEEDTDERSG